MNNQQAFDTMVQHLRKQGKRSVELNYVGMSGCKYRNSDGLRCAIGALIPDAVYRKEMEGQAIDRLLINKRDRFPQLCKLFEGIDEQLLSDMQNIHDFNEPDRWERQFELCADAYNLNYTAPEGHR